MSCLHSFEIDDNLPCRVYQMGSISALISFITIASITINMKVVIHLVCFNQILTHNMTYIVILFKNKPLATKTLNASTVCSLMSKFITLKTIKI